MATFVEQSDLVVDVVQDSRNLVEQYLGIARDYLEQYADQGATWSSSNLVDVDIGTTAGVTWTKTITAPTAPTEPDYSGDVPSDPSLTAVTVPTNVGTVDLLGSWDADLTGEPTGLGTYSPSAVATLDTLPLIEAIAPSVDVSLLDETFSFSETAYSAEITPTIKTELLAVLGGDLGLPATYWTSLLAQSSAAAGRERVAQQRRARNFGAAGYWDMPSITVAEASKRVEDQYLEAVNMSRLQQEQQQAIMAREDFWAAVEQGLKYEDMFYTGHQKAMDRALAAAQAAVNLKIAQHNANVTRLNALIEVAKIDVTIDQAQVDRVLRKHATELQANAVEIEQDKQKVSRFSAETGWQQVDRTTQIQNLAEQYRRFAAQASAAQGFEGLKQQKDSNSIQAYTAILGQIDAVASATSKVLAARTAAKELELRGSLGAFTEDQAKNDARLRVAALDQAAQEAASRLDIAQAQFSAQYGAELYKNLSVLSSGIGQAAAQMANVSMGSNVGISLSGAA